MADANGQSNTTPPVNPTEDEAAKAAKAAEAKAAAEKAEADKQAAADQKAADKKAADEKKAAEKAEKEAAKAKADEEAAAAAAEDEKPKQRVVNDPTLNNRGGRGSDIQVLIDAMPDEIYDVFVKPHNLDSRGVDEETGFDLRKISNPTLDALRIRLREQGYNV